VRAWVVAFFLVAACSPPSGAPDDLAAPDAPVSNALTLTVGGASRPLAAYYSIYFAPLPENGEPTTVELLITLIDPAYTCGGKPAASLDAVTFSFLARRPGVDSNGVFARSGPALGASTDASGWAQLTAVDDRFESADGGAIFVGDGGSVTGEVHYQLGPGVRVDGVFTAPHCAAFDFAASA